jgi:hypothetical protein
VLGGNYLVINLTKKFDEDKLKNKRFMLINCYFLGMDS